MNEPLEWNKETIHALLDKSDAAVARAIHAIYLRQTDTEKSYDTTIEHNGVGFNSRDAEFLSSLARGYEHYGTLTKRQTVSGRKTVKKYWRQLVEIAKENGSYGPKPELVEVKKVSQPVLSRVHLLPDGRVRCGCEYGDGEDIPCLGEGKCCMPDFT